MDLREKIVDAALGRGAPKEEAPVGFGVGVSLVKCYAKMAQKGELQFPKKAPGNESKLLKAV